MGDAVIATDANSLITFMNPTAEALTGWQQTEAVGRAVTEVLPLIDEVTKLPAEHPVAKVLQNHQTVYLNDYTALIARSGSSIPIGDSASPLRRSTGEVSGVVLVFWDMSDRRQAELLSRALEKEKELNRLKSQFVSTVSHEFRNPLAAVFVATELLEKTKNLPEVKRNIYLQRIKSSVRSMNELMEDVLILGQAEADRLVCHPTQLDLDQFCRNLVDEFSMLKEKEISITFNSTANNTLVSVDERILRYVLTNLLSNAIKYSPTNSTIQFRLTVNPEAHTATIQIQDQGIGIPEAD
jgi:PAS domain S-box-containing protein